MRRRREGTNWPRSLLRSEDDRPAAKPATPLLGLRWTFRAKRACVVITDAEPDRLAPLAPPAPMGLRGVWVVAARCCASPPARCCADALERSFACPSANLRAPSRRGLHPRSVRRRLAAVSPRGRANSKQARVLALLCGPSGATIATVTRSTGWQPHTVRAFLAAVVRKKLGLRLESEKTDGERVYRIVAGRASADATGVPSA